MVRKNLEKTFGDILETHGHFFRVELYNQVTEMQVVELYKNVTMAN